VKIELVEGVTVTVLDSAVSIGEGGFGSYLWTLTQPLSSNCRIRITSLGDANCTDTSDGKFSILKPVIQVAVPIQGAVWKRGNIPRIKWTYTGDPGPNVRILLLKAGKRVAVISGGAPIGTAGKGSFTGWRIPRTLKAGNDYQVRVLSTQTTTVSGKSALFSIQ